MSTSQPSFAKAFIPGLVLGLIVGALAAAFLAPILTGSSADRLPPVKAGANVPEVRDERLPTDPTDPTPQLIAEPEPVPAPGTELAPPTTPPTTPPAKPLTTPPTSD